MNISGILNDERTIEYFAFIFFPPILHTKKRVNIPSDSFCITSYAWGMAFRASIALHDAGGSLTHQRNQMDK